jgi:crossover junction endonuclease MUS81
LTSDQGPRVSQPENPLNRQGINVDCLDPHEDSSGSTPRASSLNQEADQQRRPLAARRLDSAQQGGSSKEPIILPPGSFTVELVLDSREVRTQKDRDYIANELTKKGVTPRVRALELGDAMWVAKCKEPNFLAQYGEEEGDEVMLDWIVERKRLDDLIGSVKDGRFHEQKFRLRRSGIKNVIYLIEDFSVSTHDPSALKYQEMVASAIATTQVVNGYFVKKTRDLDDTIRYLARMTSLLRKMYEPASSSSSPSTDVGSSSSNTSTVALIPTSNLSSSQSYLTTLNNLRACDPSSSTTYGVTFTTFSLLTSKSDVLTLRDVFLKMLMCTRGVTGEKALEIQRRWPTPREFIEAFEEIDRSIQTQDDSVKAKERMVSDRLMSLVGRKKVVGAVSKRLAEIWGEA